MATLHQHSDYQKAYFLMDALMCDDEEDASGLESEIDDDEEFVEYKMAADNVSQLIPQDLGIELRPNNEAVKKEIVGLIKSSGDVFNSEKLDPKVMNDSSSWTSLFSVQSAAKLYNQFSDKISRLFNDDTEAKKKTAIFATVGKEVQKEFRNNSQHDPWELRVFKIVGSYYLQEQVFKGRDPIAAVNS